MSLMPSAHAISQYATTTGNLTARIALHRFGTNAQDWFSWLGERLPLTGDVLEVGAGTGELWTHVNHMTRGLTLTLADFSAVMCQQLHSIPGARVLEPGDVVSVDCGAIVDGWHGDSAFSTVLAPADPQDVDLVATTEAAMWAGIAALHGAARTSAVGQAVDDLVGDRFGIVEEYVGHGIGTAMHQPPDVPNYRSRDRGARVQPGLVVAVEPMLTRGGADTHELADGWTVTTDDGSRAAHWEHTVAVLPDGRLWVLTARDGGAAGLAPWPTSGVAAAPDGV